MHCASAFSLSSSCPVFVNRASTRNNVVAARDGFSTLLKSSKEDEIAALEEKLRQLKGETVEEIIEEPSFKVDAAPTPVVDEPFEEMLSESWKASDPSASEGEGSVIKNLLVAGALIVAAIAFSQIPIGEEGLDKYSTAKPSTSIDLG